MFVAKKLDFGLIVYNLSPLKLPITFGNCRHFSLLLIDRNVFFSDNRPKQVVVM